MTGNKNHEYMYRARCVGGVLDYNLSCHPPLRGDTSGPFTMHPPVQFPNELHNGAYNNTAGATNIPAGYIPCYIHAQNTYTLTALILSPYNSVACALNRMQCSIRTATEVNGIIRSSFMYNNTDIENKTYTTGIIPLK